jgi:hypothetical protein
LLNRLARYACPAAFQSCVAPGIIMAMSANWRTRHIRFPVVNDYVERLGNDLSEMRKSTIKAFEWVGI